MNLKEQLLKYVRYNLWANHQIAEVLKKQENTLLNQEMKSSFHTLRKTIFHIHDAEYIWLQRLKGFPISDWPSKELNELSPIDKFVETSNDFLSFLETKDEDFFSKSILYVNLKKEKFSNTPNEIIMHCMNHSTFHRGQIITMLRNGGITELPSTDLITYLRLK